MLHITTSKKELFNFGFVLAEAILGNAFGYNTAPIGGRC